MSDATEVINNYNYKNNLVPFMLVAIGVAGAWLWEFDAESLPLNDSIVNAASIYAIARGINGFISVLQSVEVGVFVASFAPGEFLDPINDMIERFSDVMVYAIASLAGQKILILMVQQKIFSVLLTISGLVYLIVRVTGNNLQAVAFKLFLSLVVVRFSLAIVMTLNIAVDNYYLKGEVEKQKWEMSQMELQLGDIKSLIDKTSSVSDATIDELEARLEGLKQDYKLNDKKIDSIDLKIDGLEPKKSIFGEAQEAASAIKNKIIGSETTLDDTTESGKLKLERKRLLEMKDQFEEDVDEQQERLECAIRHQRGESCNMWEVVKKFGSPFQSIKDKMEVLRNSAENWFSSIVELLSLMILKTMVLPLIFFYGTIKAVKFLWESKWAES